MTAAQWFRLKPLCLSAKLLCLDNLNCIRVCLQQSRMLYYNWQTNLESDEFTALFESKLSKSGVFCE